MGVPICSMRRSLITTMRSGQRHRLDLVVGDKDHRRAQLLVQLGKFDPGARAQRCIQVGKWLVEQEQRRFLHDRPRDCGALALAARKLAGPAIQQRGDFQALCRRVDPPLDLVGRQPAHCAARTQGSRAPSCADRGRIAGTPSRRCARLAAADRSACHRSGSGRSRGIPGRQSCAAAWICRSRKGPGRR